MAMYVTVFSNDICDRRVTVLGLDKDWHRGTTLRKMNGENLSKKVPNYDMPAEILEKWSHKNGTSPAKEEEGTNENCTRAKRPRRQSESDVIIIDLEESSGSAPSANNADDSVIFVAEIRRPPKKKMKVSRSEPDKSVKNSSPPEKMKVSRSESDLPVKNSSPPKKMKILRSESNKAVKNSSPPQMRLAPQHNMNNLRPIIIDGSNVAMEFGKCQVFDALGILLCSRYFTARGHRVVAFLPQLWKDGRGRYSSKNSELLDWMQKHDLLTLTPHRTMVTDDYGRMCKHRIINCHDDNFIVEYAHKTGGVIISKDSYRDIAVQHPEWAHTINNRLLIYSWVRETFMLPQDPLGRQGPSLDEYLRFNTGNEQVQIPVNSMSTNEMNKLIPLMDKVISSVISRG